MPDACPAGPVGTIPVVGAVAAHDAIHLGMHSADICCSLMLTDLGNTDPKVLLDTAAQVTHFGSDRRKQGQQFTLSLDRAKTIHTAQEQMDTQGDRNHP